LSAHAAILGTFASNDKAHLPCGAGEHAGMGKKTAPEVLAENVQTLRRVAGNPFPQAAIARVAGVDQKSISRILANDVPVEPTRQGVF